MPRFTGGDVIELTCNHPTLGSFSFHPKSNESYTVDPGGFRSDDDANMQTGDGVMINKVNRVRWSFEGPVAVDNVSGNELENLPALAGSPDLATWTITHISGAIYKGFGTVVGDIQNDLNAATLTLKISGSGILEKL